MANKPIIQVNKLVVGQVDMAHIPAVPAIPGTGVINGPLWIGYGNIPGVPTANCMIGPGVHPITLDIKGITNILGNTFQTGNFTVSGTIQRQAVMTATGVQARAAASLTTGVSTKAALNQGNTFNHFGTVNVDGTCVAASFLGNISSTFGINPETSSAIAQAAASPPKGFDMHHPTKPGWRLTHICIEGPEAAVYYRGKLKDSNYIELPDYWRGLVDVETITVHLTPQGSYQELFYEISDWGTKIKVINNSGGVINCSYVIYGERKDVDKIIPEYEGKIEDYPGRDQRSIVGYHYDYRQGVNG
jgi:hypothetical protein